MRNFRKIIFVLHFLVVVVLLPSNVFAEGQTASRAAGSGHWIQRGSDYFWMQADGTILRKGLWQVLDGKRYYLAQNSGRRLSGWVNYSGNKYYLDPATGVLVTGLAKIDGYFYCFDESGSVPGRMLTGFIRRNEKRYYAPKSGRLVSGWQVINDRKYYFGKGLAAVSGWQTINGRKYFFHKTGYYICKGWLKYGTGTYYLSSAGSPFIGYKTISGKKYYFTSPNGTMFKGWMSGGSNHKYYYGKDGALYTGLRNIGGKYYYLNPTYGFAETGWKTINGFRRYFDSNGVMKTGFTRIGSKYYLFDQSGRLTFPGRLQKIDGSYYVFASDGSAVKLTKNSQILACQRLETLGWDLRKAFEWASNLRYVSIDVFHVPEIYTETEYFSEFGLRNQYGECYVKACTFYQFANMLGYKVKFMKGYVPSSSGNGYSMHGWVEIYYNNQWLVCDPSQHSRTGRAYMFAYGTPGTWVLTGITTAETNF